MHGQRTEDRQQNWHMWPGPLKGVSFATEADSACVKYLTKAGRKIGVGDCALFRADDAPFFIGFIKKLSAEKEGNLKLSVNWLYRLGDIKLGKGASFEAAPNEIFYSFHEDEISAAALLHPCKVAFLRKGVELPSSVSSFVCRRVYDIANKCLYWLTDQDFTDEHQAEVDLLLDRTKHEMQATPSEGPSQRATSSPSPLKHETVSVSLPMQGKSKKRLRTDQNLDTSKREKLMKVEDSDAKQECSMKFDDFASIAIKHEGLMNVFFIEQLFQVMIQERCDGVKKPTDAMTRRTLLVSIIAATEKEECLTHFVQLGGLRILNDWLQEAHKGKVGDGSPKDGDSALEELLLTLIRALAKLPVDMDALKTCIVGKSVNKLRSHSNAEIQKKAKELIDTWKKRVNAEMKSLDEVKNSTAWPSRPASEAQNTKIRSVKSSAFVKPATNGSIVAGDTKAIPQSMSGSKEHSASKDGSMRSLIGATNDISPVVKKEKDILPGVKKEKDIPLVVKKEREVLSVVKEEKSCSSSQSQNNSHSWCSGSIKGGGSWKDDVKPAVVLMGTKSAGTMIRSHGASAKSHSTVTLIGPQKDKHKGEKSSSVGFLEKGTTERARVESSNQRLILRLPKPGRSPSHSVSGGSLLDGSAITNKGSPPGSLSRHGHAGESMGAAPVHSPRNIGDVKCGKSNGAGVKEESDRSCSATPECKPLSSEHKPKDPVGKGPQGNVQQKSPCPSDLSHQALVADIAQGGIDLLASVAAREVLEIEKSVSGSTAGEVQPVTTDNIRGGSPTQGRIDSRHQQGGLDGEKQIEGAKEVHGKASPPLIQESELPANSLRKGPEEKVLGDEVAMQLDSLVGRVMKEVGPFTVSGIEGAVSEGDGKENDGNSIGTSQCQTASDSSLISADEGCKDAEGAPSGVVLVMDTKDSMEVCEDALEVARQVAMEVEQEVEKYCTPELQDAKVASPSSDNAHTGSDRFASGDADVQSNDTKTTAITTDVAQVSAGADVLKQSIEAPKKGMCPSGRSLSKVDELSSHGSDEDPVRECVELASGSEAVPKEVSETKETICVVAASRDSMAKQESATNADADADLKASPPIPLSSLDVICESKDVERPVFDLNVADEALQSNAPLTEASPPMSTPLCSDSASAHASSLAAPIAVVAASKGAFIPPSNLTRTKGELGWKGSAATSAFRPAEPRRTAETSQPFCDATASTCASTEAFTQSAKQPRVLDIDLNIADDRVLEDACTISRLPGVSGNESFTGNALGASRPELDLNRVDGNDEHVSSSAAPLARVNVQPSAAPRVVLDFDLNDGLGTEEELPPQHRNFESSVVFAAGGIRQNIDIANAAPWYSAASSMPAATARPAFSSSSRPESSYPGVAAPTSKTVMPIGHTFGPFSNDIYRGAPVSSSAVPYVGSIPASFSYAGFPFGGGFPFTSASYNMGSPLNSSASSPPFLSATPSQLVSAGAVVSPYGRPYLMGSIRDIPGMESNASWVRPSLDLNTGPEVGAESDSRESARPSVGGVSQLSYQQAASLGGTLKRKEPEGSFDPFRSGFKQTAWR